MAPTNETDAPNPCSEALRWPEGTRSPFIFASVQQPTKHD